MFKLFGGLCSPKKINYVLPTVEAKQIFAQITSLYLAYVRQTFAIILRERHFSWKRINITDIN